MCLTMKYIPKQPHFLLGLALEQFNNKISSKIRFKNHKLYTMATFRLQFTPNLRQTANPSHFLFSNKIGIINREMS